MEAVEEIRENLACPQCEYNLRGLSGAVVNCPECGHECDVAKMVAQRWTLSWFQAPGLSTLFRPTAWAYITGIFIVPWLLLADIPMEARMISLLVIAGIWLVTLALAYALFRGGEGLRLALIAHVVFLGYLASATVIISTVILLLVSVLDSRPGTAPWWAILGLVFCPVGVVIFRYCRRGEQYIGERCLRRYMNRSLDE